MPTSKSSSNNRIKHRNGKSNKFIDDFRVIFPLKHSFIGDFHGFPIAINWSFSVLQEIGASFRLTAPAGPAHPTGPTGPSGSRCLGRNPTWDDDSNIQLIPKKNILIAAILYSIYRYISIISENSRYMYCRKKKIFLDDMIMHDTGLLEQRGVCLRPWHGWSWLQ